MAEKLYYTMGEIAEMFDVNPSLIRYWEAQFKVLKPKRNKRGNRLFTAQDVANLKLIYHLVKERGMTLEGARKALRRHKSDNSVSREAELMERLQKIRSLLVAVREELKIEEDEIYTSTEMEVADPEPVVVPAYAEPEQPVDEPAEISMEEPIEEVIPEEPVVEEPVVEEPVAEEVTAEEPVAEDAAPAEPMVEEPVDEPVTMDEPVEEVVFEVPAEEPAESPVAQAAEPAVADSFDTLHEPWDSSAETPTMKKRSRKPRRKKDDDNQELFAFYEQSLF